MGLHIYDAQLPDHFSCGQCHDKGIHDILEYLIEDFDCSGNPDNYVSCCQLGCPFEETGPHGDLVDKQELLKVIEKDKPWYAENSELYDTVRRAITVIEEEKE